MVRRRRNGRRIGMADERWATALIVGAGSGLSAALARALAAEKIKVALASRSTGDLHDLAGETAATVWTCDASQRGDVERLFSDLDAAALTPEVVIYNPSYRTRGPFVDLDPAEVEKALMTGASASVKGFAQSAAFAMGKFALRGLAQSMARELHPQGIHVAHVVIDGGIRSERRPEPADGPGSLLDPNAIAASYLHLLRQPRSAWSTELELRPWVERF
jgi:short-subunit dehydrogenase